MELKQFHVQHRPVGSVLLFSVLVDVVMLQNEVLLCSDGLKNYKFFDTGMHRASVYDVMLVGIHVLRSGLFT
jgi:hypothetical protein